MEHKLESD